MTVRLAPVGLHGGAAAAAAATAAPPRSAPRSSSDSDFAYEYAPGLLLLLLLLRRRRLLQLRWNGGSGLRSLRQCRNNLEVNAGASYNRANRLSMRRIQRRPLRRRIRLRGEFLFAVAASLGMFNFLVFPGFLTNLEWHFEACVYIYVGTGGIC